MGHLFSGIMTVERYITQKRLSEYSDCYEKMGADQQNDTLEFKKQIDKTKKELAEKQEAIKILESEILVVGSKKILLIEEIDELKKLKENLSNQINGYICENNLKLQYCEDKLTKAIKKLSSKEVELSEIINSIERAKEELFNLTRQAFKENRLLERRRKDIEIYEKRLRRKYPEEKINL